MKRLDVRLHLLCLCVLVFDVLCVCQTKCSEEERQQEEELLEAQSVPMRKYLMEHVMPTLTHGLIECCTVQPEDPVDCLVLHAPPVIT